MTVDSSTLLNVFTGVLQIDIYIYDLKQVRTIHNTKKFKAISTLDLVDLVDIVV